MLIEPFTVTVSDLNNKKYRVYCLGYQHTVEFIKFALSQQLGIERESIGLISHRQTLENDITLEEYDIDSNTKITLVITLTSGRNALNR
jgi:hypothetical protein